MSVLDDVMGTVNQMSLVQLLWAFLASTCYAALQSRIFRPGSRAVAAAGVVLSALGFVLTGDAWVHGVMWIAFALAAWAGLTAAVWLLCRLLGFQGRPAPRVFDSAFADSLPGEAQALPSEQASRPVAVSQLATQPR